MRQRLFILFIAIILLAPTASALSRTCTRVIDPPHLRESVRLCADNYYPHNYPQGISIEADNIGLDCGTSVMHGTFKNSGIVIVGRENITIKSCQISNYDIGIWIKNSKNIVILDTNLFHNYIGIKIIDSTGVTVEDSLDVSIKRPVQLINSRGNVFHFVNKDLEGEVCRLNQCNEPSGVAEQEHTRLKEETPKKFLRRILNDAIRAWIFA